MSGQTSQWAIAGAAGEPILGDCHLPSSDPRSIVIIAHGFKGFKDYGMFPRLAERFAKTGHIAHRINFSHSGMTNDVATFARPDLFERDTWNKQVADLSAVRSAIGNDALAGAGLPQIVFGHSRGGVTALLEAGRTAAKGLNEVPAAVITAAAPSTCNSPDDQQQQMLLDQGFLESPSSRTGQVLRVGREFLQEQLDEPAAHDLLSIVRAISCPVLLIHGSDDSTVPAGAADELRIAIGKSARTRIIAGADHVFNTPNPFPANAPESAQLKQLMDDSIAFLDEVLAD